MGLRSGAATKRIFKLLAWFARPLLPASTVLYAYKGIGQMIVRQPELLASCQGLISSALAPEAPAQLKRQCLSNLQLLLAADEDRQRTLSAPAMTGSAKKA